MAPSRAFRLSAAAVLLLAALPAALAHGGEEMAHGEQMQGGDDSHAHVAEHTDQIEYPPTYFAHGEHGGLIYAHIALMVISWIIVLPVGG